MVQQLIKQDIKSCIINIINNNLKICIGLIVKPLYNFTIKDVDFVVHNKITLSLFYNKNTDLVIKIIENEKTKVVSDFLIGSSFGSFDIDISNSNLIPFYNLTTALYLYRHLKHREDNYPLSISSQLKTSLITVHNCKKANSYYMFDLTS